MTGVSIAEAMIARAHDAPLPRKTIAVIDSGWDRTIVDSRVLAGIGLVGRSQDLQLRWSLDDHDAIGHGTSCSDVILRLVPDAFIVPVRVFGDRLETSPRILIQAIEWATSAGVTLINLSLSTTRADAAPHLYRVCQHARELGVTIIAAAHPGPGSEGGFPATLEPVLGVGTSRVWWEDGVEYCPQDAVEVRAGSVAQVRGLGGEQRRARGTSVAAAAATGHVARLLDLYDVISLDDVRERLKGGWAAPPSPLRRGATRDDQRPAAARQMPVSSAVEAIERSEVTAVTAPSNTRLPLRDDS